MTSSFAPFGRSGRVTRWGYPERDGAVVVVVVVGLGQAYYEVGMEIQNIKIQKKEIHNIEIHNIDKHSIEMQNNTMQKYITYMEIHNLEIHNSLDNFCFTLQ